MPKYYTDEDVRRWEKHDLETIPFQLDALRKPGVPPFHRWQRYGHLSGAYHSLAMVAITRKKFDEARQYLHKSIEMDFEQYEINLAQRKATSAGDFQSVLLAYVTMNRPLISKMVSYYKWEDGVAESVYLGKIIKSLALDDVPTAHAALSQKRPKFETMFKAYPDCLQAIANKDQVALQIAVSAGSAIWAKRAARYEKGMPHAVCFLQGAGLVRLAEHVMNKKLSISDDNIPAELLA